MGYRRREYVRSVGLVGAVATAGCLGLTDSSGTDARSNVVLPEPDREFESSDVPYPAWGEQIPDVTVPAPLEDRAVTLRESEKPRLLTFFYSSCRTVCPVLVSALRNVQAHALENGYGDAVEFYPLTFDPARDDAETLRQYGDRMNVDVEAGNWHFLRPRSEARAKDVIQEQFGVAFEKQMPTATGGDDGSESDGNHTAGEMADGNGHQNHEGYMFVHASVTVLVNGDDYVERGYRTKSPDANQIIADLRTVRNA